MQLSNHMTHYKLCCVIPVGPNQTSNTNLISSITNGNPYETEYLLVLDNTSVSMSKELQEFSAHHSNVRLMYSNANNPGGARNLGITEANSDWIVFFDADDSFNALEILKGLDTAVDKPHAIIFDFTIDGKSTGKSIIQKGQFEGNTQDKMWHYITRFPGIWRWVFRTESICNSKFEDLKMGEDLVFLINFFKIDRRIAFSPRVVYDYTTSSSTQLTKSSVAKQDLLLAFKSSVAVNSTTSVKIQNRFVAGLISLLLYSGLRHLSLINRVRLVGVLLKYGIKSWSSFKMLVSILIERPRFKYREK